MTKVTEEEELKVQQILDFIDAAEDMRPDQPLEHEKKDLMEE